jgi:hypothetical protein
MEWPVFPFIRLLLRAHPFFLFGGGLSLHKVQLLIIHNPLGVPTTCFAILPLKISCKFFLSVPSLPNVIAVLRSTLRCRSWLYSASSYIMAVCHMSLIRILPRSCCIRPRFLMQFLHSWPLKRLFSSLRPFRVLGAMSSFPCLCSPCSLPRATFAQRVVLIPGAASSLRGLQFSCSMPLLHGGSSSCRRRSISSWIHNLPGSIPSASGGAPRPDSGPYAASSVLRPASLRILP